MGIDAPSRWALLALGLANVLAIGTLLFIVARSLAKLYFERRSGILGSRLRTRLVLALLAVGIAPSIMLFLVGRNFISKNVDRWFRPETQEVIRDGQLVAEDLPAPPARRAWTALASGCPSLSSGGPAVLRRVRTSTCWPAPGPRIARPKAFGPRAGPGAAGPCPCLAPAESQPRRPGRASGCWARVPPGRWDLGRGLFMPRATATACCAWRSATRRAFQVRAIKETLETLPQSTFLFLTLLSLFAAVWVGPGHQPDLSEPVRALAKAAQRVGTGDLEVSLPEQGGDELAFLARSFNTMIRDLKQSREAIEAQAERIESQRAVPGPAPGGPARGRHELAEGWRAAHLQPRRQAWLGLEAWDPSEDSWEDPSRPCRGWAACRSCSRPCGNPAGACRRSCAWAARAKAVPCGPSSSRFRAAACWPCWRTSPCWPRPRSAPPGRRWPAAWPTR